MEVQEISNEQFDEYLSEFDNESIYQSNEYAETMKLEKYQALFYKFENDGSIKGLTMILVNKINGFRYAYAPHGYLMDYTNDEDIKSFTQLLKKQLRKKKIMALKISPLIVKSKYSPKTKEITEDKEYSNIFNSLKNIDYYHFGNNNYFESLTPRFESIISINKKVNELFKSISKNYKNKIKKANFQGIKIYKGSANDIDFIYNHTKNKYPKALEFYKNLYSNFEKKGKADIYYAKIDTKVYLQSVQINYQKQVEKCNKANSLVFKNREKENNKSINRKLYEENILNRLKNELVYATNLLKDKPEGVVLAAAVIIRHQKCAYLFMDGYDNEYKNFNAKHLLIWKLIEKYSLEKYKKFNMGAIANYNLKDNENAYKGLNEFRLDFGAIGYEYIGDFEIITSKFRYFMYQTLSPILKKLKKKESKDKAKEEKILSDIETKEENKKISFIDALKILFKKKD